MKSCIYIGRVRHRRFKPLAHEFSYPLFMMYIDLSEANKIFRKRWLWSSTHFAPAWFRRADHHGDPETSLEESIRDLVETRSGKRPTGPIRLLTHFRYFGYCFNPVSFYYCFDETGVQLQTIVAEVNNTPWKERHCYVLTDDGNLGSSRNKRYKFNKEFHVSPFMEMEIDYDWRFMQPDEKLNVHMENRQTTEDGNNKVFDATLAMKKLPINGFNLALVLTRFPVMTGKVIISIYYQALKLWRKKATFHPHPKHDVKQFKHENGEIA